MINLVGSGDSTNILVPLTTALVWPDVDASASDHSAVICIKELLEILGITVIHFSVGITLEEKDSEFFFCVEEENDSSKFFIDCSIAVLPIVWDLLPFSADIFLKI